MSVYKVDKSRAKVILHFTTDFDSNIPKLLKIRANPSVFNDSTILNNALEFRDTLVWTEARILRTF